MARNLNDYLNDSERANTPEVREMRAVFELAYGVAVQVIELREKHGLTQEALASRSGISQEQISRIERGVVAPTTTTLAKIGRALGVELRFVEHIAP